MNFQRFGLNQVSNFYLKSVRTQAGHVAQRYRRVPIRSDSERGALDLMGSGRPRSGSTSSFSDLIWAVRS
jgi:hypothetical protein